MSSTTLNHATYKAMRELLAGLAMMTVTLIGFVITTSMLQPVITFGRTSAKSIAVRSPSPHTIAREANQSSVHVQRSVDQGPMGPARTADLRQADNVHQGMASDPQDAALTGSYLRTPAPPVTARFEAPLSQEAERTMTLENEAYDLMGRGDMMAAKEKLDVVMERDPQNPIAMTALATIYKHTLNDTDTARDYLERALLANPSDHYALNELIDIYTDETYTQDGLRALDMLIKRHPEAQALPEAKATLLRKLGNPG